MSFDEGLGERIRAADQGSAPLRSQAPPSPVIHGAWAGLLASLWFSSKTAP